MAQRVRPLHPANIIVRKAMRQGLFGDSRAWKSVAYLILARRAWHVVMEKDPRTVALEKIRPGEVLILRGVTGPEPPTT